MDSSYSESDTEEQCSVYEDFSLQTILPFHEKSIEKLILSISDKFDFRVVLSDNRVRGALIVTTGLTIAGGLLGRHYGGNVGAAVGGAIGGACGLGIVAVSMRSVWDDIKPKLHDLFEIVYDYLAGLGLDDYKKAGKFLIQNSSINSQLAMIVLETASTLLGNKILSNILSA